MVRVGGAYPHREGSGMRGRRLLIAVVAAAAVGGAAWVGAEISGSRDLRLAALEVRGLRTLSGADIISASGLRAGDRIFAVDLDSLASRLEELPWVRSARAHVRPPDRIYVAVEERRRLAWLDAGGDPFGVDAEGIVLPPRPLPGERIADLDLPVIRCGSAGWDSLQSGDVIPDSSLFGVLGWLTEAVRGDSAFSRNVSTIEPLSDGALALRMVADGLEVRVPATEAARHMGLLKRMMNRIYGRKDSPPAYVDLRYDGQVVVGPRLAAATGRRRQKGG
jgi:cell division septal protein FtsQ